MRAHAALVAGAVLSVAVAEVRAQAPEPDLATQLIEQLGCLGLGDFGRARYRCEWQGDSSYRFRADSQLTSRDSLSLEGDVADTRDVSNANVSMLWAREVREDSNLALELKYDLTQGFNAGDVESYDLNLEHRLATSARNKLAWGLGYRAEGTTGFIQNDLSLARNKVLVSVGTTLEQGESSPPGMRPHGRVSWKPSGLQTLWTAVSKSVRRAFPQRPQAMESMPVAGDAAQPLTAWEVGYKVQPQPALSVSMATFYGEYGRTTNFEQTEDTYGAAVTADFQATSRWKLSAKRTAIHTPELADSPQRLLSLTSSLELPSSTKVDATYRRATGTDPAIASYDELEVRLAWRPRSALELSFSGKNLLNDQRAQPTAFTDALNGMSVAGRMAEANVAWVF